jgi:type IV secretory pathway TraG/TraD family ATPase VirD4
MYYPFLAQATGKLVLQCFQSAVAKRHLGISKTPGFFSCYLDDFQDYIYPGFVALLNKSRSANIGIVFSHQALGDLDKVSPAFRNIVLTNTNVKVVMRNNDPETCEYFAKSFGTKTTEKATERRQKHSLGETRTGEGSVREVEEFIFHPNTIRQLGTGEAIVSIPHPKGVKMVRLKASKKPDLPPVAIPRVEKILAEVPKAGSGKAEKPKLGTEDEGEQA